MRIGSGKMRCVVPRRPAVEQSAALVVHLDRSERRQHVYRCGTGRASVKSSVSVVDSLDPPHSVFAPIRAQGSRRSQAEMSSQPFQHGSRTLAGACVVLLASAILAPSPAEAGCSHDVISVNTRGTMRTSQLDILNPIGSPSNPIATHPPSRPRPCSGALCSGKPAVPPVPVVSTETQGEQWGELLSPPAALVEEGRWLDRAKSFLQPVLQGPSIDRPPRASAISHS